MLLRSDLTIISWSVGPSKNQKNFGTFMFLYLPPPPLIWQGASIRANVGWLVGWSVSWSVGRSVMLSSKSMKNRLLRILNDLDSAGRGGRRDEEERGGRRNGEKGGTRRREGWGGRREEESEKMKKC